MGIAACHPLAHQRLAARAGGTRSDRSSQAASAGVKAGPPAAIATVAGTGMKAAMVRGRLLPLPLLTGSHFRFRLAFFRIARLTGIEIRACLFPERARLAMRFLLALVLVMVVVMGLGLVMVVVMGLVQVSFAAGFVVGFGARGGPAPGGFLVETHG